jgi:uncharacterized Zn-binding protein involved in type VI secretion
MMRKAAVRHGDPTTTKGLVLAYTSTMYDNGKQLAIQGDKATCGNCKGSFDIAATGKSIIEQGRFVVLDGDLVMCACQENRVIVGSSPGVFIETAVGSTLSSTGEHAASSSSMSPGAYDERIKLTDATGNPLANMYYTVKLPSGETRHGVTDARGCTSRYSTDGVGNLQVYLGHRNG